MFYGATKTQLLAHKKKLASEFSAAMCNDKSNTMNLLDLNMYIISLSVKYITIYNYSNILGPKETGRNANIVNFESSKLNALLFSCEVQNKHKTMWCKTRTHYRHPVCHT